MKEKRNDKRLIVQLWIAVAMVAIGCGLLISGFIVSPEGEIHSSVLVAFGETLTFAGSLLGILYKEKRLE